MTTLNYSQLLATYGRPRRVTTYTTGSGTHTLLTDGALCTITLVGGGGGGGGAGAAVGSSYPAAGGGGGQTIIRTVRLYGSQAYSVGTGGGGGAGSATTSGTAGAAGGVTTLGCHAASGGGGGGGGGGSGFDGGYGGGWAVVDDTETYQNVNCGDSIPGGAGSGAKTSGGTCYYPGCPIRSLLINSNYWPAVVNASSTVGGSGGGSVYGGTGALPGTNETGGATGGTGANGTGYGSGGGGGGASTTLGGTGGNGTGGLIIIEEWE